MRRQETARDGKANELVTTAHGLFWCLGATLSRAAAEQTIILTHIWKVEKLGGFYLTWLICLLFWQRYDMAVGHVKTNQNCDPIGGRTMGMLYYNGNHTHAEKARARACYKLT